MRSAGNFHPEWGYLAPTPSFARTLRVALVATAIGATAGAGVVVSLIAHPASGSTADSSIAAHALVTGVPAANSAAAAPAPAAAPAAAIASPADASPQQAASPGAIGAGTNTANAASAPPVAGTANAANGAAPAEVAHVEEPAAAAPAHEDTALLPEAAPSKKTVTKKHRASGYEAIRRWQASREAKKPRRGEGGFEPLFRLFSWRTGSPFSAN
jgi:hypothetical protein